MNYRRRPRVMQAMGKASHSQSSESPEIEMMHERVRPRNSLAEGHVKCAEEADICLRGLGVLLRCCWRGEPGKAAGLGRLLACTLPCNRDTG